MHMATKTLLLQGLRRERGLLEFDNWLVLGILVLLPGAWGLWRQEVFVRMLLWAEGIEP